MNQGITGSVFGVCEGNAAVTHIYVFRKFHSQGIAIFHNTDVIGCCEFLSSAKDVERFTVFLGKGSRISRIITGELQVSSSNGFIHFTL